jgi:endonuclease/exonuclease/phosphatase family metal-dependent hydrolase
MKIATSNMLAEKPYRKYGKAEFLEFDARAAKFRQLVRATLPDLLLLQEVDDAWRQLLLDSLPGLGYAVVTGPCWSSGLAIAYRGERFAVQGQPREYADGGVLLVPFLDQGLRLPFTAVNLHAPWSKAAQHAEAYGGLIPPEGAVIVAGDWNTDGKPENTNESFLLGQLMAGSRGFSELTAPAAFTARGVRNNQPEKIDYVAVRGFPGGSVTVVPEKVEHLLPHAPGGVFDPRDPLNHFSDHAWVMAQIAS